MDKEVNSDRDEPSHRRSPRALEVEHRVFTIDDRVTSLENPNVNIERALRELAVQVNNMSTQLQGHIQNERRRRSTRIPIRPPPSYELSDDDRGSPCRHR